MRITECFTQKSDQRLGVEEMTPVAACAACGSNDAAHLKQHLILYNLQQRRKSIAKHVKDFCRNVCTCYTWLCAMSCIYLHVVNSHLPRGLQQASELHLVPVLLSVFCSSTTQVHLCMRVLLLVHPRQEAAAKSPQR